jgi:hypothetical protein
MCFPKIYCTKQPECVCDQVINLGVSDWAQSICGSVGDRAARRSACHMEQRMYLQTSTCMSGIRAARDHAASAATDLSHQAVVLRATHDCTLSSPPSLEEADRYMCLRRLFLASQHHHRLPARSSPCYRSRSLTRLRWTQVRTSISYEAHHEPRQIPGLLYSHRVPS